MSVDLLPLDDGAAVLAVALLTLVEDAAVFCVLAVLAPVAAFAVLPALPASWLRVTAYPGMLELPCASVGLARPTGLPALIASLKARQRRAASSPCHRLRE